MLHFPVDRNHFLLCNYLNNLPSCTVCKNNKNILFCIILFKVYEFCSLKIFLNLQSVSLKASLYFFDIKLYRIGFTVELTKYKTPERIFINCHVDFSLIPKI